jgi:predicted ATPase
MNDFLEVKNFGPIKHAKLKVYRVMVFIGPQSMGKSTLAKLLAIFKDYFEQGLTKNWFQNALKHYNISSYLQKNTEIKYKSSLIDFEYKNSKFKYVVLSPIDELISFISELNETENQVPLNKRISPKGLKTIQSNLSFSFNLLGTYVKKNPQFSPWHNKLKDWYEEKFKHLKVWNDYINLLKEIIKTFALKWKELSSPLGISYIPAERMFISLTSRSLFSFNKSKIPLPNSIVSFGSMFEYARDNLKSLHINELGIKYEYLNNQDVVHLPNKKTILLSESSSGYQTLIPLLISLEAKTLTEYSYDTNSFVIEEPELNIFPSTQKKLVERLIKKINSYNGDLIITTHSPYIVSSLSNLIKAHTAGNKNQKAYKEVSKIIESDYWIGFDDVGAYYVDKGSAKSIMNAEFQSIDANPIDSISDEIEEEFDKYLNIQYSPND